MQLVYISVDLPLQVGRTGLKDKSLRVRKFLARCLLLRYTEDRHGVVSTARCATCGESHSSR